MAISLAGEQRKGTTRLGMSLKIVIRSVKLAALGLFLNNGNDWSNWRIPGVLQVSAQAVVPGAVSDQRTPYSGVVCPAFPLPSQLCLFGGFSSVLLCRNSVTVPMSLCQ